MNRIDSRGPARLRYLDGEFEVITPGPHVLCAVTGKPIALDELKYWSVDRQEAYIDIEASATREAAFRKRG